MEPDIRFPHLGIEIEHLERGISIGGFTIAFYGIIIAFGMVMGFLMASLQAQRTHQNKEIYLDLALWDIVFAVIGARIYYVIFSWDYYKENPLQIFNTRGGGLAIYGGVIAGVLTTWVFARVRKLSFWTLADTACVGLLTGQIIGRWGNFVNREAFGGYTDNLLAMQIKASDVAPGNLNWQITSHMVDINGTDYIQVHPTFLYESLWNLGVLLVILVFTRYKKYEGQLFQIYLLGYGLGRLWIEGLRTDQLILFGTGIPVSQLLSGVLVVVTLVCMILQAVLPKWKKKREQKRK